jgi:hypothetical protein
MQIHGGMGFIEETGAAQYLRDARITTIYEGTTGIQANDLVGRKVGHEKGATALAVIEEMRQTASALNNELAPMRVYLKQAIDDLNYATRWIVETFPKNPNSVAAVAVPYLKLFGTVAGGWMMARAALIAQRKLGDADADAEFLRTKLATAQFYMDHLLPQATAYRCAVIGGADSVMALAESAF